MILMDNASTHKRNQVKIVLSKGDTKILF